MALTVLVLVAACGGPARVDPAPGPRKAKPGPRPPKTLEEYRRVVLGLGALEALKHIRESARRYWEGDIKKRFPARGAGWFPPTPCCSFRGRRCPAVAGDLPAPWRDLRFSALKKPRRFQYRFFSSGEGKDSTFVADARGDTGCNGQRVWFRLRGRVEGKDLRFVADGPDVVRGEDPRKTPLAGVELLSRALTGTSEELHEQALEDLQRHKARARPLGLKLIKHKEVRLRRAAATLLWRLDLDRVAPLLLDPDRTLRSELIEKFARPGPRHPRRLRHLAAVLEDGDAGVVIQAARALCLTAGLPGLKHAPAALSHEAAEVRKDVVVLLGLAAKRFGARGPWADRAAAALGKRLDDTDEDVRIQAAETLPLLGDRSIDHLIRALTNSNATVRRSAAYGLGTMGTRAVRALPALRAHLKSIGKKGFDRDVAKEAIRKVEGKKPPSSGITLGASSTGVRECDEFLRKYEKCALTRAPRAAHDAFKKSIATMRESYRKTARFPSARRGLANSCKRTEQALKRAMAAFKCKW